METFVLSSFRKPQRGRRRPTRKVKASKHFLPPSVWSCVTASCRVFGHALPLRAECLVMRYRFVPSVWSCVTASCRVFGPVLPPRAECLVPCCRVVPSVWSRVTHNNRDVHMALCPRVMLHEARFATAVDSTRQLTVNNTCLVNAYVVLKPPCMAATVAHSNPMRRRPIVVVMQCGLLIRARGC